MEYAVLGWLSDGPTLRLDHERFSYAGKFVMSATGKAVARTDEVVGATAFDADRTDPDTLVVRYVTVRRDRQGEGIGSRLLRYTAERGRERGFECVRIAVNNPIAYQASYRAGFAFTGESTGVAELVCAFPATKRDTSRYRAGFKRFSERDLPEEMRAVVDAHTDGEPPPIVPDPAERRS